MAWTVPSDLVIVPSVPVTPDPAVAGPCTAGQEVAQDPVHVEVVEVSVLAQYTAKPLALVTTGVPLMVMAIRVVTAELKAEADDEVAGLLLMPELPHAETASAAAARPTAAHIFRISMYPLSTVEFVSR